MLGVILISIGTFFEEVSDSIGKYKAQKLEEGAYVMAFLSLFWGTILFVVISALQRGAFVFSEASLPTLSVRAVLEIIQSYVSARAVIEANRSTYGFVRTLTIPLLLLTDLFLGYGIHLGAAIGIVLIVAALLIAFSNHGIEKQGLGFVLFSAVNAVLTISLFKYDIAHFNSVVAEQLIINVILLISFSLLVLAQEKKNPFMLLANLTFSLQSAATGIGGVIESFGYNYGAASIMTAAKRSSAIFWSILSGKTYFKEKNIFFKLFVSALMLVGLVLLAR
ncbi:MAG TPA: hypothetical protein VF803_03550 [Candidatus Paceibacterota bacterium]